jgi:hypothetical protein
MGTEKWLIDGVLYNFWTEDNAHLWHYSSHNWQTLDIINEDLLITPHQMWLQVKWLKDNGARKIA